ncbi:MAG: PVC-type heme-binding CxxCH protein, partial [Gemmataceae bacterium]
MSRYSAFLVILCLSMNLRAADEPKAADPRLVVERFAGDPDIVHPIGACFDAKGRLLVIESHTHFPPAGYKGLKHDRVRLLEDTNGDGKADKFSTFFEGTKKTMDIARHPDGTIYLATRNEILRLPDTDGDGKADSSQRIVFLDTKGDYPHNGLSGLCFDFAGNLTFGLGENLGAAYKLIGADGTTLADQGEGGNIFTCTANGKKLRRVATGFWNPFGIERDIFGRVVAADNDPDASPPCRLLHVVEGGNYGYQFRYGRSGRHPFQAWNGQLYGVLPQMAGTGEAPCEIISYESTGLPAEYRGQLLVAAWADHRVERYIVKEQGATILGEQKPFVQGPADCRPVGIAVAPDGSLFVTDWVLRDYNLHGKGAVWHVRWKDAPRQKPLEPGALATGASREQREAVARKLLALGEEGREKLRESLKDKDVRVRATALTALLQARDPEVDLRSIAEKDAEPALRAMAVRGLREREADVSTFVNASHPGCVRFEAIAGLPAGSTRTLVEILDNDDPFLRHAAVMRLAKLPELLLSIEDAKLSPRQRAGLLLALRRAGKTNRLPEFLKDADPQVRLLAVKWVADDSLSDFRPQLEAGLEDPKLSPPLYLGYATALARIEGKEVSDNKLADYFLARLADPAAPAALKAMALRLVPAGHKNLKLDLVRKLIESDDQDLRLEAVRLLCELPVAQRFDLLRELAKDEKQPVAIRAQALAGLAERGQEMIEDILPFVGNKSSALRDEALRCLIKAKLSPEQQAAVEKVKSDLSSRVLGKPFFKDRPEVKDTDAWLKKLQGRGDEAAGRRIFFQPKLAGCYRCHAVDGRGQSVGPELSTIGLMERKRILESILEPNLSVAPHYQLWEVTTEDGLVRTGVLTHTHLDEST